MTAFQRLPLAFDLTPLSWIGVTLAVLPGLAIVWLRSHSAAIWLAPSPITVSPVRPSPVVTEDASAM